MTKSTKIMLTVIASVLAFCIVITMCVSLSRSHGKKVNNKKETDVSAVSNSQDESNQEPFVAPLNELLLGKWSDSSKMSGYEFFADGTCNVTYVNLTVPVLNLPVNGSASGTYSLTGDQIDISFSIYQKTISKHFTVSVSGSKLEMKNAENGDVSTYIKEKADVSSNEADNNPSIPVTPVINDGIYGSWRNEDGSVKYKISKNGLASVSYQNANVGMGLANGTYDGVCTVGAEKITFQFIAGGSKITQEFSYQTDSKTLVLTDSSGATFNFVPNNDEALLLGKWQDSTKMSGYEFKSNGKAVVTYVNFTVPVINMPINGSYDATYTVNGNDLTVTQSIYSKTITKKYTFTVFGSQLTLVDKDTGAKSAYSKVS